MQPPPLCEVAMPVVVTRAATVSETIGLICWQYTEEGREPELKSRVDCYCLRICEESGEVDADFPSLNHREPVCKFGFPSLALVEKKEDELQTKGDSL